MFDTSNLFSGDDEGVSPVIGVILMVAITVILAAVIGTFVLGLGNNVSTTAQAGVNTDETVTSNDADADGNNEVEVEAKYVRKGNVDQVELEATLYDGSDGSATLQEVGDTNGFTMESGQDMTIYGVVDGERQVIRTYTVGA